MTYFIGGNFNGQKVPVEKLHEDRSPDWGEKSKGMAVNRKNYIKTRISFHGTVKTFYIIEGEKPIDYREQIIELRDEVPTDIYAI